LTSKQQLFGLLLLALFLRFALWSQPPHQPANDEREYIAVAQDLLAGKGWVFYDHYRWLRAPLYPLFLAGSLWLTNGDWYLAAWPNIILSLANVYLIYLLTQALFPRAPARPKVALLAALGAALLQTFSTFASLSMSETLFTFLFLTSLILLLREDQPLQRSFPGPSFSFAGILFGLACLTRSLPLAFLPLLMIWLARSKKGAKGLLFGILVGLTICPWTIRNCLAYQNCILVETGFSYNLWAFSEPKESLNAIHQTLERIPNPASRAEFATQKGLQRLREDATLLLRKVGPNWTYLWRVKPIEDRFLLASSYADPPSLVFLSGLIFDDLLYLCILLLGIGGLSQALGKEQTRAKATLVTLWLSYVVGITLVTHGEGRYRHFLLPFLIPYAAWGAKLGFERVRERNWPLRGLKPLLWASPLLLLLFFTVATNYPWDWARRGALRSFSQLKGDSLNLLGKQEEALEAYKQALNGGRSNDAYLVVGDTYRKLGKMQEAEASYRTVLGREPLYIAASLKLGDLLREQGRKEEAREAFAGKHASEEALLTWSWQYLKALPPTRIDVGDGLDFGFVKGVYAGETIAGTKARWTKGEARFRLRLEGQKGSIVRVRLTAPRPQAARLCGAQECQELALGPKWRLVAILYPPTEAGEITLQANPFEAEDGRRLGIVVDWLASFNLRFGDKATNPLPKASRVAGLNQDPAWTLEPTN